MLLTTALLLTQLTGATNLLAGAAVRREEGVTNAAVIRDGKATWEGDNWDSPGTSVIGKAGVVEWDLGESKPVAAALLQADNNDDYLLEASDDGTTWRVLWRAPPDSLAGLRTRTTKQLTGTARFLRLSASGGDGLFSLSELGVYATAAEIATDPWTRRPRPPPPDVPLDRGWFVLAALTALLVWYASSRRQQTLAAEAAAEKAAKKDPPKKDGDPESKSA